MSITGDLIADRYRLVDKLGAGAMGVVWEARDERLQRQVALKQLRPQLSLDPEELELANQRAMREARISARLHHPYAVTVFDVVEHEDQPCLIMQFVPSVPLSTVLREGGPLTEHEAAKVGAQVGSALAAAHQAGIVHRDIKPGNILIADDGTALISDFGISRALGDASLTMTGMVHGTPAFLAPEVARGAEANAASDVFSLGATLYATLEGSPPFGSGSSAIAILHRAAAGTIDPPQRSGSLAPLLLEMLAAEPKDRPSMAGVAEQLEQLKSAAAAWSPDATVVAPTQRLTPPTLTAPVVALAAPPPTAPPPPPAQTAAPLSHAVVADEPEEHRSKGRGRLAVALVALLAVAAVLVGLMFQRGGDNPDTAIGASPSVSASDSDSAPSASASESTGDDEDESSAPPSPTEETPVAAPTEDESGAPSPTPTEKESEPSASPSESKEPTTEPTRKSSGKPSKAQLAAAVRDYYALMPKDTDAGWRLLTPAYRASHGGSRGSYEQFWGDIERVRATDLKGVKPDQVQATITYNFKNGQVSRERTTFRLVRDDDVLKIEDSTVG